MASILNISFHLKRVTQYIAGLTNAGGLVPGRETFSSEDARKNNWPAQRYHHAHEDAKKGVPSKYIHTRAKKRIIRL